MNFQSATALASKVRARARAVRAGMDKATAEQARLGQDEAQKLTNGPQRSSRTPSPVSPRLPVGKRSGRLNRGWKISRITGGRRLRNTAPHHIYVLAPGGTSKMASRRFWEAHRKITRVPLSRIAVRIHRAALTK